MLETLIVFPIILSTLLLGAFLVLIGEIIIDRRARKALLIEYKQYLADIAQVNNSHAAVITNLEQRIESIEFKNSALNQKPTGWSK